MSAEGEDDNSIFRAEVRIDFNKTRSIKTVVFKSANDNQKKDPDWVIVSHCDESCKIGDRFELDGAGAIEWSKRHEDLEFHLPLPIDAVSMKFEFLNHGDREI